MPKLYGEPYDPALRKTELGARLYQIWRRMRQHPHFEEWDYFPYFYEWSIQNGYAPGASLRLIDDSGIHAPDNCEWFISDRIDAECKDRWNKTVNRIRKHYGMPPLEGTSYDDL